MALLETVALLAGKPHQAQTTGYFQRIMTIARHL